MKTSKTMVWIPDSHLDLINDDIKAFAYLATIMRDGSPQVTPVWFNTDYPVLLINTAKGRVKDRNMHRDHRVALTIADPEDAYRYIQIRGKVVEIQYEGAREHINALSKKYTGKDIFTGGSVEEIRVIYKILPEHVSV